MPSVGGGMLVRNVSVSTVVQHALIFFRPLVCKFVCVTSSLGRSLVNALERSFSCSVDKVFSRFGIQASGLRRSTF
jgi:hypothetical protein